MLLWCPDLVLEQKMTSTLGERVSKRRNDLQLSQEDLAKKAGVSRVAISKAEIGMTKNFNGDTLFNVARALQCDPEWLQTGKGNIDGHINHVAEDKATYSAATYRLPVFKWQSALEQMAKSKKDVIQWLDTTLDVSSDAFWLKVETDAMTSPIGLTIPEGMMILIVPKDNLNSGDLAIFKRIGTSEILFRKYVEEAGDRYLRPLNQNYKMIRIDEQYAPVGVVVEAKWLL
jgi:SOS-response transcriptional repressor LexA